MISAPILIAYSRMYISLSVYLEAFYPVIIIKLSKSTYLRCYWLPHPSNKFVFPLIPLKPAFQGYPISDNHLADRNEWTYSQM